MDKTIVIRPGGPEFGGIPEDEKQTLILTFLLNSSLAEAGLLSKGEAFQSTFAMWRAAGYVLEDPEGMEATIRREQGVMTI